MWNIGAIATNYVRAFAADLRSEGSRIIASDGSCHDSISGGSFCVSDIQGFVLEEDLR